MSGPLIHRAHANNSPVFGDIGVVSPPAASSTYYFGFGLTGFTAQINRHYIERDGVINIARVSLIASAVGSGETFSIYLRKNNTTDYTITSVAVASGLYQTYQANNLNIPVVAGDYFEGKYVTPAWVTAPTNLWDQLSFQVD